MSFKGRDILSPEDLRREDIRQAHNGVCPHVALLALVPGR